MKDFKLALIVLGIFGLMELSAWVYYYIDRKFWWEGLREQIGPWYYYTYWTIFWLVIAAVILVGLWYWNKKYPFRKK